MSYIVFVLEIGFCKKIYLDPCVGLLIVVISRDLRRLYCLILVSLYKSTWVFNSLLGGVFSPFVPVYLTENDQTGDEGLSDSVNYMSTPISIKTCYGKKSVIQRVQTPNVLDILVSRYLMFILDWDLLEKEMVTTVRSFGI